MGASAASAAASVLVYLSLVFCALCLHGASGANASGANAASLTTAEGSSDQRRQGQEEASHDVRFSVSRRLHAKHSTTNSHSPRKRVGSTNTLAPSPSSGTAATPSGQQPAPAPKPSNANGRKGPRPSSSDSSPAVPASASPSPKPPKHAIRKPAPTQSGQQAATSPAGASLSSTGPAPHTQQRKPASSPSSSKRPKPTGKGSSTSPAPTPTTAPAATPSSKPPKHASRKHRLPSSPGASLSPPPLSPPSRRRGPSGGINPLRAPVATPSPAGSDGYDAVARFFEGLSTSPPPSPRPSPRPPPPPVASPPPPRRIPPPPKAADPPATPRSAPTPTPADDKAAIAAIRSSIAPTTTPNPIGGSDPSSGSDFESGINIQAILDAHNQLRALTGAPPLKWSTTLAEHAAGWGSNCVWDHSHSNYGENLGAGNLDTTAEQVDVVRRWYDEVCEYDFSAPGFSMVAGHFTQVVWKTTVQVGCAFSYCADGLYGASNMRGIFVCNYYPPGNYMIPGAFQREVSPPSVYPSRCADKEDR